MEKYSYSINNYIEYFKRFAFPYIYSKIKKLYSNFFETVNFIPENNFKKL